MCMCTSFGMNFLLTNSNPEEFKMRKNDVFKSCANNFFQEDDKLSIIIVLNKSANYQGINKRSYECFESEEGSVSMVPIFQMQRKVMQVSTTFLQMSTTLTFLFDQRLQSKIYC